MLDFNKPWKNITTLDSYHTSWIYGVTITPDEKTLASVSFDKILLWDIETGNLDFVLEGHTDIIFSLDISPNGKFIVSGSLDKTVRLWDLENKSLVCVLAKRKDPIYSVAFSPDGNLIASGGASKYKDANRKKTSIYLWSIKKQELICTFSGHDLRINSLAFSPDSKILASGSNDKTVRLWNVDSKNELQVLKEHSDNVSNVAFTQDGQYLLSSGGGGINQWNVKSGELEDNFASEFEYIKCFAIHPCDRVIAIEVQSGIKILDLTNKQKVEHLDFSYPISITFSPNGKYIAGGDLGAFAESGGIVKIWSVPELQTNLDTQKIEDTRRKTIASIIRRQGQKKFRQDLLDAYDNCCCITGVNVVTVLEAAHIIPYLGVETNILTNGLLLRADIHVLFDLYLLSINPNTLKVEIAPMLENSLYEKFAGQSFRKPTVEALQPNLKSLQWHYERFLDKQSSL